MLPLGALCLPRPLAHNSSPGKQSGRGCGGRERAGERGVTLGSDRACRPRRPHPPCAHLPLVLLQLCVCLNWLNKLSDQRLCSIYEPLCAVGTWCAPSVSSGDLLYDRSHEVCGMAEGKGIVPRGATVRPQAGLPFGTPVQGSHIFWCFTETREIWISRSDLPNSEDNSLNTLKFCADKTKLIPHCHCWSAAAAFRPLHSSVWPWRRGPCQVALRL